MSRSLRRLRRRNRFASLQSPRRKRLGRLSLERLETRRVLDASGFPGNECPPDLDLSAIETQTIHSGEELVLDLFAAGGTVVDLDAAGDPTGDTIWLQLDPDDTADGATLSSDGVFRWTPGANQTGTFQFVVIAVDSGSPPLADAEVFTVVVAGNSAPDLAAIDDASINAGVQLEVTVTATDADGDNLTFLLDYDDPTSPTPQDAVIEKTGDNTAVIRWTPNSADAGQTFGFSVLVVDDGAPPKSDRETFSVSVSNVAANPDDYQTDVDEVLTVDAAAGVLSNDVESGGAALTAALVSDVSDGVLALADDGSFTYTPDAGFRGTDSFTYRAEDGSGAFAEATVTILVNAAPIGVADEYATDEDAALTVDAANGVLSNDTDGDDDALTATLVSDVANGTLVLNSDGSFTYTPDADFNGSDSFTYRASDGISETAETTVTITVNSVNDAPVGVEDEFSVNENTTLTVDAENGVLANDTDAEDDTLTATLVTDVTNGTLTLAADGSFTYEPDADFSGTDTFTYRANDGADDSAETTVTIMVANVNAVPVGVADEYTTNEDAALTVDAENGVLSNDTDGDDDDLTATLVTDASNGTLVLNSDGSFTYTPDADFNGSDTFTYRANDGTEDSAETTVTITIAAVNDAPAAVEDSYTMTENGLLTTSAGTGVLANDTDAEDDTLTATLVSNVSHGVLTLNPNGSFFYNPDNDYSGTDTFTYMASDGVDDSAETTVTITITNVNNAPMAVADEYSAVEDQTLTIAAAAGVLSNDNDADGDTLTAALEADVSNGTLTLNSDGSFTYVPDADFSGVDSFTYRASDGTATSAIVTVSINVSDQNAFVLAQSSAVGTVVGVVTPEGDLGSDVVYAMDDATLNPALELAADDHISGNPAGQVVLIEYADYQCPVCKTYHPIVQQMIDDFGDDLMVVTRHFPLTAVHVNAYDAAIATEAAGRQGAFFEYGDLLFEKQDEWKNAADPQSFFETYATQLGLDLTQFQSDLADQALTDRVQRDLDAAIGLGATGTPTFFLDGVKITNPASETAFSNAIQARVDAVDATFSLNRETGEITVYDATALDIGVNPTFTLTINAIGVAANEVLTVTIDLSDE